MNLACFALAAALLAPASVAGDWQEARTAALLEGRVRGGEPGLAALVQKDFEEGVARGIARTPTALVNGEPFIETFTVEQISAAIDAALKENGIQ